MISKELKNKIKKRCPFLTPFYAVLRNWRLKLMKWRPTYDDDNLITNHYSDFMYDERFKNSFETAIREGHTETGTKKYAWITYVACWAADIGKNLEGDFVECGVGRGRLSRTAMEYIDFGNLDKKFYLIDTYNGFDRRYLTDKEKEKYHPYLDMYDTVKKGFSKFPNAVVVRGSVPDVLKNISVKKVAYLSLDMNCMIPEIAAADFFWDKMSRGAVMILDDYGRISFEEQHNAFDKFAKNRGIPILCLPTGQGLIIKP